MSSSPAPQPSDGPPAACLNPLTAAFLDWQAAAPRPDREVMEAWRTACPRLTLWEDALDAGLVARTREAGRAAMVRLTPRGRALLSERASRP